MKTVEIVEGLFRRVHEQQFSGDCPIFTDESCKRARAYAATLKNIICWRLEGCPPESKGPDSLCSYSFCVIVCCKGKRKPRTDEDDTEFQPEEMDYC
ncbi:uncharacterized protein J3R85_014664 [Psidium guajava]|nr:uncharacterized protein J3R85_014664 [Psidium guajava]